MTLLFACSLAPGEAWAVGRVLLLQSTVTSPYTTSKEYLYITSPTGLNYAAASVDVYPATLGTWPTTVAGFKLYDLIVFGDPNCSFLGSLPSALQSPSGVVYVNRANMLAACDGNRIVIGTDPEYHYTDNSNAGQTLIENGLDFAVAQGVPKTGLYACLSCYYDGAAANTPVAWLDGLGTPALKAQGSGCCDIVSQCVTHAALTGLTPATLSNWSCSTHNVFNTWPSGMTPLAIASGGCYPGATYNCNGDTGQPYILVSGTGIAPLDTCLTMCVPSPPGLSGWWPLDEATGPLAYEISTRRNGTLFNGPTFIDGKVNGAYRFDCNTSTPPYVEVKHPGSAPYNYNGDFTIDAWIRLTSNTTTTRTIVAKESGTSFTPKGYQFFIDSSNRLAFRMASGTNTNVINFGNGPPLTVGQWYYVAVTANPVTKLSTLYAWEKGTAGGGVYGTNQPYTHTGITGSITNTAALRIGQQNFNCECPFCGDIDEVEIYRRKLSTTELDKIFDANEHGKCKLTVKMPYAIQFSATEQTHNICVTICNNKPSAQKYEWDIRGLPAGSKPGGNIDGPTSFTPDGLTSITVPALSCQDIIIAVGIPANLTLGTMAYYEFTVRDIGKGDCVKAQGRILPAEICTGNPANPCKTIMRTGEPAIASFEIRNTSAQAVVFDYQLDPVSPPEDSGYVALSLNGLPPGTPVIGSLSVPANGTAALDFSALLTLPVYFRNHYVILSGKVGTDPIRTMSSMEMGSEDLAPPDVVPVASDWTLVAMSTLLLAGGALVLLRRRTRMVG